MREEGELDEADDLCTNIMACGANDPSMIDMVNNLTRDFENDCTSYESSFNKSLLQFREQDFSAAIYTLLKSFERANTEGAGQKDLVKYKVQELHMLNCLTNAFNQVEYKNNSGFVLTASQARNNLIEANM